MRRGGTYVPDPPIQRAAAAGAQCEQALRAARPGDLALYEVRALKSIELRGQMITALARQLAAQAEALAERTHDHE